MSSGDKVQGSGGAGEHAEAKAGSSVQCEGSVEMLVATMSAMTGEPLVSKPLQEIWKFTPHRNGKDSNVIGSTAPIVASRGASRAGVHTDSVGKSV